MDVIAAVVREHRHPFSIEHLELDEPRGDDVLVRIVATGLCHTDLVYRDWGAPVLPAVLGHEGAGIVERVGDRVTNLAPGDHVVLSFLSCGNCATCTQGLPAYCSHGSNNMSLRRPDGSATLRKDGQTVYGSFFGQSSFATYALASARNAVKVRTDVPLERLGPLGCGVQTGAGAVLNSLRPRPGSAIAIFGAGGVGLSAVMAAVIAGCTTIIAVDVRANRLELARTLGATHQLDATGGNIVDAIRTITSGGINFALDTTARPDVIRQAVESLAPLGMCGLIGVAPPGTELRFDYASIAGARFLRGIYQGDSIPGVFIPTLIDLHLQGRFPFDRLLRFYPLREINEAAEASERGDVIKPVLRMDVPAE